MIQLPEALLLLPLAIIPLASAFRMALAARTAAYLEKRAAVTG